MKKILRKFIVIPVLTSALIFFALALGLILSQRPTAITSGDTISFDAVQGDAPPAAAPIMRADYTARDGTRLVARHIPARAGNAPLVIVVHGSGWHGGGYVGLGQSIAKQTGYEVIIPDLRGHGAQTQTRGDVAYIGQLEDDLADLIAVHGGENRQVIMVGHSSGGGLVIRFAGGPHGALLDRAVLMAPFLKYNAPTTRQNAGGWARPLTRRIIGLSMLNMVKMRALNGMTIIQFSFPKEVLQGPEGDTATQSYSYRMNTSYAPRNDYLGDIAKLPAFLLIVGEKDDAFVAREYEHVMASANPGGHYVILPGVDRLGVINDARSADAISGFIAP